LDAAGFEALRDEIRRRLSADPAAAYRDWYAVERELAGRGDADACRGLADDLWDLLPRIDAALGEGRGKFFNDLGAFFGAPGPAADLGRAEECFARAVEAWTGDEERRARALHNRGSALAALGEEPAALARAVACLEEALAFRTGEREIARAVTLHHLGIARRKLAERALEEAAAGLERSRAALEEALAIRRRQGLAAGAASSRFQLAVTLSALGRIAEAREAFREAADGLEASGKTQEAALARRLAEE
jgi:tetratricopeptide (TPR) repeat protein